ncbi:hypothetical protein M9435_002646 [Picochlorum sp. BPE23]|nr:hypothetical protein M9435_002646 [Picochlorum sp. BPE23]
MSGVPREGRGARSALSEGLQSLPDHDDDVMEPLHHATSHHRDDGNILYGENVGEVYGSGPLGTSLPTSYSPARQGDFAGSFNIGSYHGHGHMMHHRRRAAVGTLDDDHNGDSGGGGATPRMHGPLLSTRESSIGMDRRRDSKTFRRPVDDMVEPLLPHAGVAGEDDGASFPSSDPVRAAVFGMINATAGIPALIAFASIVFQHPHYSPFLDLLCKFFFVSSALHQSVFNVFSTLPFAMGQVQDVGIIFMSGMATSIADYASKEGLSVETALGTSLLTMTVSTVIVGLGTYVVAKNSWAGFVQYIPLPVMGGYLGFVGYFCVASGVGLGSSQDISSIMSWMKIFNQDSLIKLIPTVSACVAMVVTMERARHPMALPVLLFSLIATFHVVLLLSGISLTTAQEAGWVMKPADGPVKFWDLWKLYHFEDWSLSGICFPAMLRQGAKTAGLLLVVIFGSCMDIAAVSQDVPVRIDFNKELTTVALSNIATGVAGVGFTGSYIFSQTIFTMRAGIFNRVNGWVIASAEFLVFMYPYSIVQYIPNFFLGALMIWFGFEISRDWLFLSYQKLTRMEYVLLWMTFFSVMEFGLEGGIGAGIVCATLYFSYAYAQSQVQNLEAGRCRSSVIRTVEHQAALSVLRDSHTVTVQLQGFIFFGSASSIGTKLNNLAALLVSDEASALVGTEVYEYGLNLEQCENASAASPRFLVIDFSKVSGMDSSGSRTISGVTRELQRHGITPILTGLKEGGMETLLTAHEVVLQKMTWPPKIQSTPLSHDVLHIEEGVESHESMCVDAALESVYSFPTLEEGVRFCEDALLEVAVRYGVCRPPSAAVTLEEILKYHLEKLPLIKASTASSLSRDMKQYIASQTVRRGEMLWRVGDAAEEMIIVERGIIRVDQFRDPRDVIWGKTDTDATLPSDAYFATWEENRGVTLPHGEKPIRSFELGPGCVGGSTDFHLARPHSTHAVCASIACRVLRISKKSMQRMAKESPHALVALQMIIMRLNSSDLFAAADFQPNTS